MGLYLNDKALSKFFAQLNEYTEFQYEKSVEPRDMMYSLGAISGQVTLMQCLLDGDFEKDNKNE